MIIVHGYITIKDGHLDAARALGREHVRRSRLEPGCVAHAMHADDEDPQRLVFVEKWADLPALLTHFRVPESIAFAQSMRALAAGVPVLEAYESAQVKL